MKNLGMMNCWYPPSVWDGEKFVRQPDKEPAEYKACVAAKHVPIEQNIGRCLAYCHCPICGISWEVDSSD